MAGRATTPQDPETPAGRRDQDEEWLSVGRAADLLGVTPYTLRDWTGRGVVAARRTNGGHRRYSRADIERLVAATRSGAALEDVYGGLRRLTTLADVSSALFGETGPEEVLRVARDKLIEALDVTTATVSLFDPLSDPARAFADHSVDRGGGLLVLPLVYRGQNVGMVELADERLERRYEDGDLELAQAICVQVAVALHNAGVYEQLARQNTELKLLLETGEAIAATVEISDVLNAVARTLTEAMGVAWCDIYDYDEARDAIVAIAFHQVHGPPTPPGWLGTCYPIDDFPDLVRCAHTRRPQLAYSDDPEMPKVEREEMERWEERATLSVPLIYLDEIIGVMDVAMTEPGSRWSDEQVRIATTVANQAAIALKNARLFAEVKRSLGEVAALQSVAAALVSANTIEEVLVTLAVSLREALDVYACEIYDYDPVLERVTFLIEDTLTETPDEGFRGWYDTDEVPTIATTVREHRATTNYLDDPRLPATTREEMERWGDQSSVTVPMMLKDRVVGVIYLCERRGPRRFSEDDLRIAETVVAQGTIALENARAHEREQRDREQLAQVHGQLQALFDLSSQLQGVGDEEGLLEVVGRVLGDTLEFRQWVVWLYESGTQTYSVGATLGSNETFEDCFEGVTMPERVMSGLLEDAVRISTAYFVDHTIHCWTDEERESSPGVIEGERGEHEWNTDDTLLMPMIDQQGELLGYIEVYDPRDRQRPTDVAVRALELFASRVAVNLKSLRLNQQLEQQATTDALTGLHNRRFLMRRFEEEIARAARYGQPLSVLMIDIDDFKWFNDTYGHPQGDKLLVAVAETLFASTREKVDVVSRYGGEEFVVLLPSTPVRGAGVLAERLREAVGGEEGGRRLDATGVAEAIRRALESRRFEGYPNRRDVQVTVSVGVACCPEHGTGVDELMSNSDKALYEAKALGKNRTCVFGA